MGVRLVARSNIILGKSFVVLGKFFSGLRHALLLFRHAPSKHCPLLILDATLQLDFFFLIQSQPCSSLDIRSATEAFVSGHTTN